MSKKDFDYVWTDKKRTIFGLPLSFTRYFLTETKFITRVGLFNLVEDELDLYTVKDKKLVLSLGNRIFKCGTIIMLSLIHIWFGRRRSLQRKYSVRKNCNCRFVIRIPCNGKASGGLS